jgi:hypothetical protein
MKRRRSSPRSSPLIGEDPTNESKDATQNPTTSKVQRASAEPGETHADNTPSSQTGALKCSLPPTCAGRGRELFFSNVADMERHHATYHTHTCLDAGCGKVFPDARFLTLVSSHSFVSFLTRLKISLLTADHSLPFYFSTKRSVTTRSQTFAKSEGRKQ